MEFGVNAGSTVNTVYSGYKTNMLQTLPTELGEQEEAGSEPYRTETTRDSREEPGRRKQNCSQARPFAQLQE